MLLHPIGGVSRSHDFIILMVERRTTLPTMICGNWWRFSLIDGKWKEEQIVPMSTILRQHLSCREMWAHQTRDILLSLLFCLLNQCVGLQCANISVFLWRATLLKLSPFNKYSPFRYIHLSGWSKCLSIAFHLPISCLFILLVPIPMKIIYILLHIHSPTQFSFIHKLGNLTCGIECGPSTIPTWCPINPSRST